MDVCILSGGTGTRLQDASGLTPKALVKIGGIPLVVHIMRIYANYGHASFVLALGYKQEAFKHYFYNYELVNNDVELEIGRPISDYHIHGTNGRGWRIVLADTGEHTLKGGRLKRVERYVKGDTFFLTYGDAVSDINLRDLFNFHIMKGKIATITGIHPTSKFGEIRHDNGIVTEICEKPQDDGCLINGGFMVFNRQIFDYLDGECDLEVGPLEKLAAEGQLAVYHHRGMWMCVDTPRELGLLQEVWDKGGAPWVK